MRSPFWLMPLLCLLAAGPEKPPVTARVYTDAPPAGITDTLADPAALGKPTKSQPLSSFEWDDAPQQPDVCDLSALVVPPQSGRYFFYIAGDDTAVLFLSTDDTAGHRKLIAQVPVYSPRRDYHRYASMQSSPIELQAGKKYFIEAVLQNITGDSHVSVAWQLPDGSSQGPIPGSALEPFTGEVSLPSMTSARPELTLTPESPIKFSGGFHRFVKGAHAKFPDQAIDLSYVVFMPESMPTTDDKKPLMVFLHGNGHQGVNLAGVLNEGPADDLLHDKQLEQWMPMMCLFPQLPEGWRWDTPGAAAVVNGLIQQLCEKYPRIDRNRIYLTGLSMGGKGSWLTALDSPDTFAAVATISAVAVRPAAAKVKLANLKGLQIICGAEDGEFCAGSKRMYETLEPVLHDRVKLTVVPNRGHTCWDLYYPHREFYEGLMKYTKSQ